jgi:hypothetical protein
LTEIWQCPLSSRAQQGWLPLIAPLLGVGLPSGHRLVGEATDVAGDGLQAILHREVPRIEPMPLGGGHVGQVCLAALAGEAEGVRAPEDERLGLTVAQKRLPLRIDRNLGMVGLLGQEHGRGGRSAGTTTHQLHLVPHGDVAPFDHKTVERELAVETPVDVAGNVLVLDQRVGMV